MEPKDTWFTWFVQRTDFISPISKQVIYLPVFLYTKFTLASSYLFCLLLLTFFLTLYLIPFPYSLGHIFLKPGAGVGGWGGRCSRASCSLKSHLFSNQPQPAIHAGRWVPKQKGPSDQVELYLSISSLDSWLIVFFLSADFQGFKLNSAYTGYRQLCKHLALLWEQSKDGTMRNPSQSNQWQMFYVL